MGSIILKGYIEVPDSDLNAVLKELPNHIGLTRAETGCNVFEVVQHSTSPNRFDVYEEFADQAAFDAHQARVKRSAWGRITAAASRQYEVTTA